MADYKKLYFFFFLLISTIKMNGQATAWIEKKTIGDSTFFQGMVHNNTSEVLALKYTMIVEKASISGKTRNHQQNSFKAVPKSTVPLGKTILNVTPRDYYRVVLQLFLNNKLLTADTLQQGTAPIPITNSKQEIDPTVSSTSDAIEIDGLIIDETRTKPARDFYEIFYSKWTAPRGARDFTITIRELPSRGRSAQITVIVNDKPIYQRFLQPRLDVIEAMVDQSIFFISRHLVKTEDVKQQMQQEDHKGSGIF
ncbi:MAG: curli-like amyloid fiber formation chaperone CsgH [Saprospiraceae bacterium]